MLSPAHSLSPRSRSVLRELDRLGVRVVPATGRARAGSWTEDVLTEPALRGGSPGVFCNGCIAYDTDGSALPPATLPRELPSALLRTLAAPGAISCCPIAYVGDEALHDSGSAALLSQLAEVGDSPLRCVADLSAACEAAAVTKILLLHASGSDSDALRASVSATVCNGGGALTQALDWMLEVIPADADKGTAATALLARWGLGWEDVLAIGDGENDLPLLARAGTSVAMGNGGEAVRRAAQHVVGSNAQDGWAEAMERFVISVSE
ncbi:hypothetical protein EMIHUDRAFT_438121 [Emiliania huxleyi CCMP1516]|uniref:Haloacid dehalogenase-like hydrolase n=2 Tax=Emiliania huxleyi TaxID=2903 RepID=A0A0D3IDE8_EMIH1|nr:hypothetical protein EMIHUDRAFT_438121 [Emiliania huxleyi CCMP1516]EOD09283.1 hypothetical protein EMIHUDRAFT_438121 [Emiliania huxleyi CCMP1516]|eukprot:XP_005761712.1 hypothetical protein EMIHUDRAFT_438121 [Emiliania huxleyi CCMP1516]